MSRKLKQDPVANVLDTISKFSPTDMQRFIAALEEKIQEIPLDHDFSTIEEGGEGTSFILNLSDAAAVGNAVSVDPLTALVRDLQIALLESKLRFGLRVQESIEDMFGKHILQGYEVAQKIKRKPDESEIVKIQRMRDKGLTWVEIDQERSVSPGVSRNFRYRTKKRPKNPLA